MFRYFVYLKKAIDGNIRIYHECEGGIEKLVPRITVWLHEDKQSSQGMDFPIPSSHV